MIKGVAIKHNNIIICLPKPNRHNDCIKYAVEVLKIKPPIASLSIAQGFYTEDGVYLDRVKALSYAELNKQIKSKTALFQLYSEDLW